MICLYILTLCRTRDATLTTLIVDDEQLACDELAYLLKDFPEVEVLATGSNGLEAVKLIQNLEPDLVFLDVQMPGLDGMGVVRKLREQGIELPHFIFVTAYDQYAVEAFRWEALDYLLKPVDKDRLAEAIERARSAIAETAEGCREPSRPASRRAAHQAAGPSNNRNFIVDAQDVIYATIDRRADHGGGHQCRRPIQLPHHRGSAGQSRSATRSGACTGRTW